ncbi:hypothetical protein CUC08_Gglean013024 [Alternaria sp. MG1]|nr:hypothetical protein IG631_05744 [Alternaria alternata]RII24187.1 hypothetical protein CUC08_Gglean013024 [Alternaria sp. MG1]
MASKRLHPRHAWGRSLPEMATRAAWLPTDSSLRASVTGLHSASGERHDQHVLQYQDKSKTFAEGYVKETFRRANTQTLETNLQNLTLLTPLKVAGIHAFRRAFWKPWTLPYSHTHRPSF